MNHSVLNQDEIVHFMQLCIALAHDAIPAQEVPVSALYVHLPTRTILCSSFNQTVNQKNAIRHCEVECLSQLNQQILSSITNYLQQQLQPPALLDPINPNRIITTNTKSEPTSIIMSYISSIPTTNLQFIATNPTHPLTIQQLNIITRTICYDIACIVSVEPCIMCTGVLIHSGIKYVYAGCGNIKFGGCGSVASCHLTYSPTIQSRSNDIFLQQQQHSFLIPTTTNVQHQEPHFFKNWNFDLPSKEINSLDNCPHLELREQFNYTQGILETEAIHALQIFYLSGNANAPSDKRQRQLIIDEQMTTNSSLPPISHSNSIHKKSKSNLT